MRSYALVILALAATHARAGPITAPVDGEKLSNEKNGIDDVSIDNNDSESELIDQTSSLKDIENNLRNSAPLENVPVKVVEVQPIIKTIALKEDSNDYVPDNDDSTIIKRIEIDLKNPGPPQRQEHDSQNPAYYIDKERAVAAIKQSIAESENVFLRGVQNVKQNFQNYFANNEELTQVKQNIQNLRENVNAEVVKLSDTINSYLNPVPEKDSENPANIYNIAEVENHLKLLKSKFNSGVDMLSEGVEILSILKEEDEDTKPEKISGKADNAAEATASSGSATANPAPDSSTTSPAQTNPVFGFIQQFQDFVGGAFNNTSTMVQNIIFPNQNPQIQTQTQSSNIFQGIPNIFQGLNQNQNQNPAQTNTPVGTQSDEASTEKPNFFQQVQNSWQNLFNQNNQQQPQQNQNPFQFIYQGISNLIQSGNTAQTSQPTSQADNASIKDPAADGPTPPAQGSNSVPAPAAQAAPAAPAVAQPVQNAPAQPGPIQQIVQNNPIVKGIAQAVQRIQGTANPNTPRDKPTKNETKGHRPGGANNGDNNDSGLDAPKAPASPDTPVKDEPAPESVVETQKEGPEPEAELNKTE